MCLKLTSLTCQKSSFIISSKIIFAPNNLLVIYWNLPLFPVIHEKDYSYHKCPRRGHKLRRPDGLRLGITIASDV